MLLYHGMYNIAHFEINNSVPLYTNTAVGDAYDYKRLRKVCFESGGAYINDSVIDGGHVRGGAHVTIQEDSIFLSIIPENPDAGIVYGLTFFIGVDGRTMYVYAEKREGGGGGDSGVNSFNGRHGSVVSADGDYNAGMVDYDNTDSGLVADDVQSAIDELAYENENLSDDVEDVQQAVGEIKEDVTSIETAIETLQTNVTNLNDNQNKQIAYKQTGTTASRAFSFGDWIIDSDGYTGIVLTNVSIGDPWVLDTNYKRRTIGYHFNHTETLYTVIADGVKTKGQAAQEIIAVANALGVSVKRKTILSAASMVFNNVYASSTTARYVSVQFSGTAANLISIYGSNWQSLNLLTGTITDESSDLLTSNLGLSEL